MMGEPKKIQTYIHIGYPKNASTTLQTDIFADIEGAKYIGRFYDGSEYPYANQEVSEAIHALSAYDSINYSAVDYPSKINDYLSSLDKSVEKVILSSEAFSNNVADRSVVASRLKVCFPDAKIIVVIRNQLDALQSMYGFLVCQMGRNINLSYGRPSIASFENWVLEQEAFMPRSYILTLKYYEFISVYWDLFGKENVTVLLFEELASDPEAFFEKLSSSLGVDNVYMAEGKSPPKRNSTPSQRMLWYYKVRSHFPNFVPSNYLAPAIIDKCKEVVNGRAGKKNREQLPSEIVERLAENYKEGNKKLEVELDIDLEKYGYLT